MGARSVSAAARGAGEGFGPAGVLADFIEVDAAHEKATEDFLHEELEYVVVQNWNEAERGIDIMRTDLDGRATFLVHPEPDDQLPARDELVTEDGVLGRLSDYLRFTNGFSSAPAHLLQRLARCYIARD